MDSDTANLEDAKQRVAEEAANRVQSGQAVGLGTGSTATLFIKALYRRISNGEVSRLKLVSSSHSSTQLAHSLGLELSSLDQVPELDLYIDGADEVDPAKNLIKGRGAAMLREKIMAAASREFLVLIDASKKVERLGTRCKLPVEVLPFALALVEKKLSEMGGKPELRMAQGKDGPVITDNGNLVLDMVLPASVDYTSLDANLNRMPGVLEHGLFIGYATEVLVATDSDVERMA